MTPTYGQLRLRRGDGRWTVSAEPHVMIRLKRIFPRVAQHDRHLVFRNTDEVCRDLLWAMERFPLRVSPDDQAALAAGSAAFDQRALLASEIQRGTFKPPEISMHLPPRPYQATAAALLKSQQSLLLADSLGLGKTVSALAAVALTGSAPVCVVCQPHLQQQWQAHCWRFLRLFAYIAPSRTPRWPKGRIPDVLIISYHKLHSWRDVIAESFRFVIFDEVQELRTGGEPNPDKRSQKYTGAEHISREAEYRMGLSATPIYNYGDEFWPVLEAISPGMLGSRDEFLREWCTSDGRHHAITDPPAFRSYLAESGIMLRRTKRDVGRELPALSKIVQPIPHDLEPLEDVRAGAAELARVILDQAGKPVERMQAAGEFDMRLRQATGIAKAPHVAAFVRMLLESEPGPVVLFGWHREVYRIWNAALADFRPVMYTGSESPAQKARSVDAILRGQSRVFIMSLRSGSGLDGLQRVCSRVVIGELDWSPAVIDQGIGRVHRDEQPNPVEAFYAVTEAGSDPFMRDVLGIKQDQIEGVIDPEHEMSGGAVDPERIKRMAAEFLAKGKR